MAKHDELVANGDAVAKTSQTPSKHVQNEVEIPVRAESSSQHVQNNTDPIEISELSDPPDSPPPAEKWVAPLISRGKNKGQVRNIFSKCFKHVLTIIGQHSEDVGYGGRGWSSYALQGLQGGEKTK